VSLRRARVALQSLLEGCARSGKILLPSQRDAEQIETLQALGSQLEARADFRLRLFRAVLSQ